MNHVTRALKLYLFADKHYNDMKIIPDNNP